MCCLGAGTNWCRQETLYFDFMYAWDTIVKRAIGQRDFNSSLSKLTRLSPTNSEESINDTKYPSQVQHGNWQQNTTKVQEVCYVDPGKGNLYPPMSLSESLAISTALDSRTQRTFSPMKTPKNKISLGKTRQKSLLFLHYQSCPVLGTAQVRVCLCTWLCVCTHKHILRVKGAKRQQVVTILGQNRNLCRHPVVKGGYCMLKPLHN